MAVLITVLLVAVITGIYFRRQSGTDRFKKLVTAMPVREQENSGIMRYCAFCGVERDASK